MSGTGKRWVSGALAAALLALGGAARAAEPADRSIFWTQDGYRVAAHNAAGESLILSQAMQEDADGLVTTAGVTFLVLGPGEDGETLYSAVTDGDGIDKLEQAVAAADGWLCVGSTSSSNHSQTWHDGWYDSKEPKTDAWIVRIDAAAEIVWSRTYGGTDWDSLHTVCAAREGGWIAAGNTYSSDGDVVGWHDSGDLFIQPDGWVLSIDEAGEVRWQLTVGGSGHDALLGICPAPEGYLAVGVTDSTDGDVTGGHGGQDAWAVWISPEGELLRQVCYGGRFDDEFTGIAAAGDALLAVGTNWSYGAEEAPEEGWAVCLSGAGDVLWDRRFGGSGIEHPGAVVRGIDFWAVAGLSTHGEEQAEWLIAIPMDGREWRLFRGDLEMPDER